MINETSIIEMFESNKDNPLKIVNFLNDNKDEILKYLECLIPYFNDLIGLYPKELSNLIFEMCNAKYVDMSCYVILLKWLISEKFWGNGKEILENLTSKNGCFCFAYEDLDERSINEFENKHKNYIFVIGKCGSKKYLTIINKCFYKDYYHNI